MSEVPSAYYQSLLEVARAVNPTVGLPQALSQIAASTARAMGAKACSIRLLSEVDQTLQIRGAYGLSERYLAKGPVQVPNSAADREALRGHVVYVEDATTDRRVQYPREAAEEGTRSVLIAPLVDRGNAIGVIRVYAGEVRPFAPHERDFLQAIAELSAIAIDGARVYEALWSEVRTLRSEVRQLREQIERLEGQAAPR